MAYAHPEHAKVAEVHPDWDEVASTKEFNRWLRCQHPNLQRLAGSFRAEDAIRLLTEFKRECGMGMGYDDSFERELMKMQKFAAGQGNSNKSAAMKDPKTVEAPTPRPTHMNPKLLLTRKG